MCFVDVRVSYQIVFACSNWILESKRKRHDMTPISKSQASSGLLNIAVRNQSLLFYHSDSQSVSYLHPGRVKGNKNPPLVTKQKIRWRVIRSPSPNELEEETEEEYEPLPKRLCLRRNISM